MGLHFGGHTTANRGVTATNRGELHYTGVRHAARRLRVVQNPHRSHPQVRRVTSKTGAGPLGAKKLARHGPSRGSSATKLAQQATKPQFQAILSAQGELFRACRRRPSSALPISTPGPTGMEGTGGAEVPGRSAGGRRQGTAIAHQLARGPRQGTTLFAQQQPHQAPSVQNSPRTPALAACPA